MEVFFKKSFLRDFKKLPSHIQPEIKRICFLIFPEITNLFDFKDYPIRKMKGFSFYWRIKIKEYRIGLKYDGKHIEFMRALHRKDIYKFFP